MSAPMSSQIEMTLGQRIHIPTNAIHMIINDPCLIITPGLRNTRSAQFPSSI
jgi:hypothetical protein